VTPLQVIENDFICVIVDPERGGTICHIGRDNNPRNNVLAWYEWNEPVPLPFDFAEDQSAKHWLSRYRGGWQFLTPNAGKECVFEGVRHSFHGESSYMPWKVATKEQAGLTMEIEVFNSLRVNRTLTLYPSESKMVCNTEIFNLGTTPQEVVIVEHAAFQGSPDIEVRAPEKSRWNFDEGYEEAGRRTMLWSESENDSPNLPVPIKGRSERMTYLTEGNEGWVSILDTKKRLGARLKWNKEDSPYIWYWQEQFSPGFPFYGRAEMTALEPASCLPSDALLGASQAGRARSIPAGESLLFSVELEII
jgi:hypothetical protein